MHLLYEILSSYMTPNDIVFLRLFCPISVPQLFYLVSKQFAKLFE